MSEMVERCAQALLNSVVKTWNGINKPWDEAEEWSRDIARKNARAVIEAMREPPEAMMNTMFNICSSETQTGCRQIWDIMIDEALK